MRTLIAKLAYRYLEARLNPKTDLLMRLSYLEGSAGVPPGSWMRSGNAGVAKAKAFFGEGLHSSWTARGDSGLLKTAIASASQVLRGARFEAEDVVQSYLVGFSPVTGEKLKAPVYWRIGNLNNKEGGLKSGKHRVASIRGAVGAFTKRRTIADIRSTKIDTSLENEDGSMRPDVQKSRAKDVLSDALNDPSNPVAAQLRDRLKQLAAEASKQRGFEKPAMAYIMYLDRIAGASSEYGLAAQIGREIGASKPTMKRYLEKMQEYILKVGARDKQLRKLFTLLVEQGALGFGRSAKSTLIKNLADRYLS